MGMWFEKRNEEWALVSDNGKKVPLNYKRPCPEKEVSREFVEEWRRAIAFGKAKELWDGTAFGASMRCAIADAITEINGEMKILVFSTVNFVERELSRHFNRNFKRTCMKRVDEFYSRREYQQRIEYNIPETEAYNDRILRPVVLQVNRDGEIEEIIKHKELLKMDIYVVSGCYFAVEMKGNRFCFNDTLNRYEEAWREWRAIDKTAE